jgi:hypothetical integral membrane protein (TIGR02206 family)
VTGAGSVGPYWTATVLVAGLGAGVCAAARRRPGHWTAVPAWFLGAVLVAEQISWQVGFLIHHNWSLDFSLPLDLCDATAWVAAVACWTQAPLCVELTYFWGLAGTLQAIITPDVGATFPHLEFFNYLAEHLAIVVAALYLVIGLRLRPRRGSVPRIFALTLGYAGAVALVDVATGADYLYLRSPPPTVSLLNVLGPWPWYVVSCVGLALALFLLLDLPFRTRGLTRRAATRVS